jgi:hypothetical protein
LSNPAAILPPTVSQDAIRVAEKAKVEKKFRYLYRLMLAGILIGRF